MLGIGGLRLNRSILIIGAGVAGLGIGWRLAQQCVAVTILERGEAAMSATHAAAGMIAATAEMAGAPEPEIAFAARAHALWPGFAAELEAASGVKLDYRQNGALMLEPSRPAILPPGTQWLAGAEARAHAPMLADQPGAIWAPDEAQVDNRALGRALALAFVAAGGTLRSGTAVTALAARGVETPWGLLTADAVLVAAGAWSGGIASVPVSPVKGQMIALTPPPGAQIPAPVIWGNGVYLVPRRDRLLVGATVEQEGFDVTPTPVARDDLRRRAEGLIPGLQHWTLAEHWAGLRPASPDGLPLLGALANGVFVAAGQYRNGILFAPAIADHMRDVMLGRADIIPAFDPQRFT